MTQEEKSLLFQDLCARLPYGVKVYNTTFKEPTIQTLYGKISSDEFLMEETYTSVGVDDDDFGHFNKRHYTGYVDFIKPYLRLMSSMTEEEKRHISKMMCLRTYDDDVVHDMNYPVYTPYYVMEDCLSYLRSIHVDYSGLIEKNLALEALEGMYDLKKK